jgi:hypothetical protein
VIAGTGSIAGAATTVNATNYTVSCSTITGSAKFGTPMHLIMATFTEVTTIKAKLSGCTATPTVGGPAVTGITATVSGTLTNTAANGCAGLSGSGADVGNLTTKWKSTPKLSSGNSVVNVQSVLGGSNTVGANTYGVFTIPGSTPGSAATGSFQGTDAGAADSTVAATTQTEAAIITSCNSTAGLKGITLTQANSGASYAVSLG